MNFKTILAWVWLYSSGSDVARLFAKRSSKLRAPSEIAHTALGHTNQECGHTHLQDASACLRHCQEDEKWSIYDLPMNNRLMKMKRCS